MSKQRTGAEILSDVEYYARLLRMSLRVQPEDVSRWQEKLAVIAIDDLPRLLDAAVTEHDVLKTLVSVARGISKSAAMGHPLARWEIMQLDDAIMGAGAVVSETAWLELSPEAPLSPDGENEEESET